MRGTTIATEAYPGRATVALENLELANLDLAGHQVPSRASIRVYVIDAEDSPRSDSWDCADLLVASCGSFRLSHVLLPIRFLVVSVFLQQDDQCALEGGGRPAPIIFGQLCLTSPDVEHMSDRTEHLLYAPLTRAALKAAPPVPTGTVRFSIRVTRDPLRFRTIWRLVGACHSSLRGLLELTFCAMVVDRVASGLLDVLAHTATAQDFTNFGRAHMYILWMLLALLGPLLCIPISLVLSLAVLPVTVACIMTIFVSDAMHTRVLPIMLDRFLSHKIIRCLILQEY